MKRTWGVIPAAGLGTRIQPLAFSKELLPVGLRQDSEGRERPRAVSEYLLDRMLLAGATQICFVVAPSKNDIISYFGGRIGEAAICYAVQQNPAGLCDALFAALPFIGVEDEVLIGLPDTIWFPEEGFRALPAGEFSFLLFPTENPEFFDAVVTDAEGYVVEVQVKQKDATSPWIWGAFKMPAREMAALHALWLERNREDQYIGTLVNEYIRRGHRVLGVKAGENYVDAGTPHGFRNALNILASPGPHAFKKVA
jgi:glucose-1-phosphate thymidylyltransferase